MSLTRITVVLLAVLAAVVVLWTQVDTSRLTWWAAQAQRDIQNTMAAGVRAVQRGDAGALLSLCGLTFAYGVVHALGPGHGKVLLGGTALANRARLRRLAVLTLLSSLGQSLTAILLVLIGVGLIRVTSTQLVDVTEEALAPVSFAFIGAIGLWLAYRGMRALWGLRSVTHHHDHDHAHEHGSCGCGHAHGPELSDIREDMSLREMAALVISIAMRPCSGALFLLVICWHLGILPAGILATLAMGLGTAVLNLGVAGAGLGLGRLAVRLDPNGKLSLAAPVMQIFAGSLIVLAAAVMLRPFLLA
ncbi:nickel/cobalt transporter [Sagittula sp. SSi028]|uniref:nickel/cobalt transporter n=1 Tax=Sagittula sp. SSi028 TaxID=3400636 RepID=UPI003AF97EAF